MSRARVQAVGGGALFVLAAVAGVIGNPVASGAPLAGIAFLVVLVMGVCVAVWVARVPAPHIPPDELGATLASQLAGRVRAWSIREQEKSGISDPRPLPVRWHTAAEHLFDDWRGIRGATGHGDGDPGGDPVLLAGSFADIGRTYEAVPSQRLVILGQAGAGKTVLAYRLIASLLDDKHPVGRVPVLFSLSGWDPRELMLRDWMIQQLLRDHPFLDDRDHTGHNGARVLVEGDWVLPVLDGFDEIPQRHYRDAIQEISRFDGPLVLTSRLDEYTSAARDATVVGRAAAIEFEDLSLNDVERYLRDNIPTSLTNEWGEVFKHLRNNREELASRNLTAVLTTPLMVMLARTTYTANREYTPLELLDAERFPNSTDLEERLLYTYLDAVYDRRRTSGPNAEAAAAWKPERARHWLGYLATHLRRREPPGLTWWQLPSMLGRRTRILTTMTIFGLGGVLALVLAFGLPFGFPFGLAFGVAFGLAVGYLNEEGFFHGQAGCEPERLCLRWRWRRRVRRSLWTDLKKAASQFTSVLRFVLAAVLAFVLAYVVAYGLAYGPRFGLTVGLGFGFAVGLAFGLAFGLANVVVAALGDVQDPHDAISPWQLLTTDRTATLVRTLVVGLAVGLTVGIAVGLAFGPAVGLAFGLAFGLLGGLARLMVSAWGQWLLFTRLWLPLTGRLPWHPKRFLEDAHRRGVLRQAGAVYQFRHAQLRKHLADHYGNARNHPHHASTSHHPGGLSQRAVT